MHRTLMVHVKLENTATLLHWMILNLWAEYFLGCNGVLMQNRRRYSVSSWMQVVDRQHRKSNISTTLVEKSQWCKSILSTGLEIDTDGISMLLNLSFFSGQRGLWSGLWWLTNSTLWGGETKSWRCGATIQNEGCLPKKVCVGWGWGVWI